MRKPDTIAYWLGDRLPTRFALGLALQQAAFLGELLVIPALFASTAHIDHLQFLDIAAATLIVSALALTLQAWNRFGIGSGYFYPLQATTAVLPALLLATQSGGVKAAFGMIFVLAITQLLFSGLIGRLRSIFTVEIAGLAVLLIGIGLGQSALKMIVTAPTGAHLSLAALGVTVLTFGTMIGLNVWNTGQLRLFAPLAGLAVGGGAGWALGLVPVADLAMLAQVPFFRVPSLPAFGWSFDVVTLLPYAMTGLMLSVTSLGTQTVAQRFNDADWNAPDLKAMARGLRAEGIAHLLAALINGIPMVASGGAVSLAATSGVTSRYLAYWTAGMLLTMALLPKIVTIWLLLPNATAGGLLLYLSTFTALSGLQLIGSRMLDNRRVLAVGTGLVTGMTYDQIHAELQAVLPWLREIAFSGMSMGLLVAALLSALFRIGVHKRATRHFAISGVTLDEFESYMEQQGRLWGARRDVVSRAEHASWQAFEMLLNGFIDPAHPEIVLSTRSDEYSLTLIFEYQGTLPPVGAERPTPEEMIETDDAEARLTGYMLSHLADRVRVQNQGAECTLRLTFEN
jgi:xanthine/uracil permease